MVTRDRYKWAAEGDSFEDDFDDVSRYGMRIVAGIKEGLRESLGPDLDLKRLVGLGELIDKAIRPPGCAKLIYREKLAPERWRRRRSPDHRDRSAAFGREMALYKRALRSRPAGLPDDDEDEDSPTPPMPRGKPRLPRPTKISPGLPSWKDIELDPEWAVSVRMLWATLQIRESLPKALWAIRKRPHTPAVPFLIRGIDAAMERAMSATSPLLSPDPEGDGKREHESWGGDQGVTAGLSARPGPGRPNGSEKSVKGNNRAAKRLEQEQLIQRALATLEAQHPIDKISYANISKLTGIPKTTLTTFNTCKVFMESKKKIRHSESSSVRIPRGGELDAKGDPAKLAADRDMISMLIDVFATESDKPDLVNALEAWGTDSNAIRRFQRCAGDGIKELADEIAGLDVCDQQRKPLWDLFNEREYKKVKEELDRIRRT